jgi:hypothetical protein
MKTSYDRMFRFVRWAVSGVAVLFMVSPVLISVSTAI